jgi:DNA-binding FadR family transcriptional regulator
MEFTRVDSSKSLVDRIVEQIRKNIESGNLLPGERLATEHDLADQFGVSRTVIREAVRRLDTVGLIETRRGLGSFVGDLNSLSRSVKLMRSALAISPQDLIEYTELRSAIECHAAYFAAERSTAEDCDELQRLCDLIDQFELNDFPQVMQFDFQFHVKLAEMTGSMVMRNVLIVIREFISESMELTAPQIIERGVSKRLHQPIVDRVRARDPDGAQRAMREHMNQTIERLKRVRQNEQKKTTKKKPAKLSK